MSKLTTKQYSLLAAIVAAGANGTYAKKADLKKLVELEYVEVNESATDEKGNVAVRALAGGVIAIEGETATENETGFELENGVEIPSIVRKISGNAKYPFDKMDVGQSFFIAATEDRQDPAKSLASTVSAANRRYAVVDPEGGTRTDRKGNTVPKTIQERHFVIRSVAGGARVWRDQ